jgi:DNA helicase-2/ATP-dependent DNA helicase PcrA
MSSIIDSLNDRQKEAVQHTRGPVLILAGAGSGKTRVLTHRTAWLIDNEGVNPWNILAITFTNKAAGEMRERIDKIVGNGSESIWVATFHSTCVRILRRYADRIGYDDHFTIYDSDDQKTLMKQVCKKLNIDTKQLKEKTILNAVSSAKDELIDPESYAVKARGDYEKEKIARAYREYQAQLKNNDAMDFDDLLVKTVELFKADHEVLGSYQERFRYIMVDEYQDTNTAQFELIRLLADRYRNLCVVGDDDQSIYKFRGANIRNILDFEKVYPEAYVVKLEQNYRSTQNVLDAANAVIRNNSSRKDKALWTDKGKGELIRFRQFDYAADEAQFIADDIESRRKKGHRAYGDFAVLYRTNAQSRLLEEQFIMKAVPYNVVGGTNFYSRREIKDMLAYLKTIDNGRDDIAAKRIINVPKRGIGAATIDRVQEYADERRISFFDALCEADQIMTIGRSASKLSPFTDMILAFRAKLKEYGMKELIRDIIETTGYLDYLKDSSDDKDDADERKENVGEFVSKIVSYEETHDEPKLGEFLEEVALIADIDQVGDENDRVLLMTLHSAKGLEFPCVYLAGMEDGLFPGEQNIESPDESDMEEERRLAYVGITRAKEELTMTCARSRMVRGETQYRDVSRFVLEIPGELFDNEPAAAGRQEDDESDLPAFLRHDGADSYTGNGGYSRNGTRGSGYSRNGSRDSGYGSGYSRGGTYTAAEGYRRDGSFSTEGYSRSGAAADYGERFARPAEDAFDKPKPTASYKPRARLAVRKTSPIDKPYMSRVTDIAKQNLAAGNAELDYKAGDRVHHQRYGDGTVMKIEDGARDKQVTVIFDQAGQKIMYAAFAKLQKLED